MNLDHARPQQDDRALASSAHVFTGGEQTTVHKDDRNDPLINGC